MKTVYTLHDLPNSERPRERLAKYGSEALSSQELLALILGRGISGEPVMVTAQKLLAQFGSLHELCNASIEDLRTVRGIGLAKACQLKAILEITHRITDAQKSLSTARSKKSILTPEHVYNLLKTKIGNRSKEHFVLVSFDTRNRVIGMDTISVGTLNASLVHPREMFEIAFRRHAASVIVAHNHPSGDPAPSDEDLRVTSKLIEAGKLLGIQVLDHIIVCQDDFYSFSNEKVV